MTQSPGMTAARAAIAVLCGFAAGISIAEHNVLWAILAGIYGAVNLAFVCIDTWRR